MKAKKGIVKTATCPEGLCGNGMIRNNIIQEPQPQPQLLSQPLPKRPQAPQPLMPGLIIEKPVESNRQKRLHRHNSVQQYFQIVDPERKNRKKANKNYCVRDNKPSKNGKHKHKGIGAASSSSSMIGHSKRHYNNTLQPGTIKALFVRNQDGTYSCIQDNVWGCIIKNNTMVYPLHKQLDNRSETESAGYLIGSDASCDIKLFHLEADKRHAFIHCRLRHQHDYSTLVVYLSDQSVHGTWINNTRIHNEDIELTSNDKIYFMDPRKYPDLVENPCFEFVKPEKRFFMNNATRAPGAPPVKLLSYLYKVKQKLATGTFGDVLLADCKTTDKQVAIKVIPDQLLHLQRHEKQTHNTKRAAAYLREVSVCLSLPYHPCIIQISRVFESNGKLYIVMEYGKDGDLFETVASRSLKEYQVRIVFDQIAHAVAFLHERGVVHRDIKLENVILCNREQLKVKLCDFGLSNFIQDGKNLETSCGTISYAAPELLAVQKSYGAEVDIWSLGVLLYTALATSTPFAQLSEDNNELERARLKEQIRTGGYNFDQPIWRKISTEAKDLIRHMLDVDRNSRYTIQDVLNHPWMQHVEDAATLKAGYRRNPELVEFLQNQEDCLPSSIAPLN